MNQNKKNQSQKDPNQGNQQQEFERKGIKPSGQPNRDRANDRGQGVGNRPEDNEQAIPELDEPDVEGVGEEGRTNTQATMPPGQGKDPKRNTM